jgi:hypothetical protein
MHSIWDSPAWHSLGTFTTTSGNLTFSYYIDWFNPLLNKTAGKTMSCGAIMQFCLNLPYELQHLVENTFFAGITPPPKEPTVTTITAVSDPVIEHLLAMYHGKLIRTYHHPDGIIKRAAVLPVIGDLMAICKALGFAGIRSHNFCSFCDLRYSNIDCLDSNLWIYVMEPMSAWQLKSGDKHRQRCGAKKSLMNMEFGIPHCTSFTIVIKCNILCLG